jgi:IclR family transcriptional regulator, pca regulon regulatory protein
MLTQRPPPRLVPPAPSNSLERALAILEKIAARPGGLTNKQISEELGIATSTCSYILGRLEREGYLARAAATGRYEIGLKVLAIARGALRQVNFGKMAESVLQRLSTETGLETLIGVLDHERLMVVRRVASDELPEADVDTGTEFPAHAMATGKVLLAHLPVEAVEALVAEKGLAKLTSKTISSADQLFAELAQVRTRGYSLADEEFQLGMRSIAVPIVDSGRAVRAALAVIGSTKQPIWREQSAVLEALKAAAREIARSMSQFAIDGPARR